MTRFLFRHRRIGKYSHSCATTMCAAWIPACARMAMVVMVMACAPLYAQEVPKTREEITLSYAPVVKKVAPAVVNIYTKRRVVVQENLSPFMNDPFFRQFFGGSGMGGQLREQVVGSLGSGVIVRADGLIVTSHHVIKDAQEIKVALTDKREFDATVVTRDPQSDLAFLQIKANDLPFVAMRDSDTLEVGDLVLAIGNPFGVGQTVTSGIISALARKAEGVSDYQFFIQTDAAINPGNSGGALVDMGGHLIGINTAIYSKGGGSNGIGFAIPANMVQSLMSGKVEGGRVVRPWLGLSVQPVTAEIAESLGLKNTHGVLVKTVTPDAPAEKGGIKPGDVIVEINGAAIASAEDMQYRVALAKLDAVSNFTVLRNGKEEKLAIAMTPPPELPKRDIRQLRGAHPLSGVTVANLSPSLAAELGLDEQEAIGAVIVLANNGNGRLSLPLAPGDSILAVNGERIESTAQLEKLLAKRVRAWQIQYRHGNQVMTLTVTMQ